MTTILATCILLIVPVQGWHYDTREQRHGRLMVLSGLLGSVSETLFTASTIPSDGWTIPMLLGWGLMRRPSKPSSVSSPGDVAPPVDPGAT